MARPKNDALIDLAARHELTTALVARLTCPPGKSQAFLRDTKAPGLAVRVTAAGAKAFVFESKLANNTIRRTIGDPRAWTLADARAEANKLRVLVDAGLDPREVDREKAAQRAATKAADDAALRRQVVTGLDAWQRYIVEGAEIGFTSRGRWGDRHIADHKDMVDPGGSPFKRRKGTRAPGPLHSLLSQPLANIDSSALEAWLRTESAKRPTRAALGFRLLKAFLNWCGEHPVFGAIAQATAHQPKAVRRLIRRQAPKTDALQREQLAAWFSAVRQDPNVLTRTYLQTLLLTGARKNEIARLRWSEIQFGFGGSISLHDKVEGTRTIPMPPYLCSLFLSLPRKGELVFGPSSMANNSAHHHKRAIAKAGLPHVSLHGLRRSFGTLAEWVEMPAGIAAQLMGHKPSATAEKHYRARPLDLLRAWHAKIEAWILAEAGISFSLPPDVSAIGGAMKDVLAQEVQ
ncbi:MAG: preprotein translocase [Ramlibacter sp.]|nr:preprotein translocase [Ramlibacter sp.]